jgi:hypothetical protein
MPKLQTTVQIDCVVQTIMTVSTYLGRAPMLVGSLRTPNPSLTQYRVM